MGDDRQSPSEETRPPLATGALLALSLLVFGFTSFTSQSVRPEIDRALRHYLAVRDAHPDARISPDALAGASDAFRSLADHTLRRAAPAGPDDGLLDEATRAVIAAASRHPSVRFGYRPAKPSVRTAITSLFVHSGWLHFVANMLFLALGGALVERRWGHVQAAAVFVAAGLGGVASHHLASPASMDPLIGASGGVAGLLAAALVSAPRDRLAFLQTWMIVGTASVALLCSSLLLLIVDEPGRSSANPPAHWAHLGGAVAGGLIALVRRGMT